jgi:hypothetical protein
MEKAKGIYYNPKTGKYSANFIKKAIRYNVGTFDTLDEAVRAREQAIERWMVSPSLVKQPRLPSNNRSGYPGVSWDQLTGKWVVTHRVDRKSHHIGRFDSQDTAIDIKRKLDNGEISINRARAMVQLDRSRKMLKQIESKIQAQERMLTA